MSGFVAMGVMHRRSNKYPPKKEIGFRHVRSLIYHQLFYKPFNFLEL